MPAAYDLFDLVMLYLGAKVLKNPPAGTRSGQDFWTDGGEPRELVWFWQKEHNPFIATARYRGWLIAQIIANLTSDERPLVTFSAKGLRSKDLLESHIYPDMHGTSAYTKAFTNPKNSPYLRHFRTSLVVGFTQAEGDQGNLITFSGGLRRQTKVHKRGLEHEALKADFELMAPFYLGTEEFESVPKAWQIPPGLCAIRFGMAISREGQALGRDEKLNIAGIRFHVAIPVSMHQAEANAPDAGHFSLGEPVVQVETLALPEEGKPGAWQQVADRETWEAIANALMLIDDGKALGKAPIGPITAQPIDRDSVLQVLKNGLAPYKESGNRAIEEWKEAAAFIEGFLLYGNVPDPPDKPGDPPDISNLNTIESFLKTLRLIKKDDHQHLVVASLKGLQVWQVLNLLATDLDGLPLWLKGIDPKDHEGESKATAVPPTNVAIQLAAASRTNDPSVHFFGLRGLGFNIPLKKPTGAEDKRDLEIQLHLGKFFSRENRGDNWIRRLEPLQDDGKTQALSRLPGIGLYPLTVSLPSAENPSSPEVKPTWGFRIDLASLGLDIRGRNALGLVDMPFFKLGGLELRTFFSIDWVSGETWPKTVFAVGAKLTGIRILTKREKEKDEDEEMLAGIKELFEDDDDEPEPEKKKPDTRLSDKVKDTFSLSLGFMTSIGPNSHPRFDAQLYNAKGKPGKVIWIKIDREKKHFYLKSIGISLKGMSNVNLDEGALAKKAKLAVLLTGGLRFANFELGFIGAGLNFPIGNMGAPEFELEGLDLSIKAGQVVVSGSFMKTDNEFAGYVRIQLPTFTIGAMGAFGKTEEGETTMFIYGALNFAEGGGFGGAAFRITGIAVGLGINRRVMVPDVDNVASFPLVKMVMGKGGLPDEKPKSKDIRDQTGKPMEKPMEVLEQMADQLKAEKGQNFGALGLRFTIAETVDCFALAIVQFGNELEISLLGLGRMKLPRSADGDEDTPAICYAELQLAATFKPAAGLFKVEARLSNNSWIFHKDCRLTGGFALYIWYGGKHKGDFVFCIGGYHPRFVRPSHYPDVPRLGIRWPVSENLLVKGGLYFAITPSCGMVGGAMEACFKADRVRASFNIYLDLVVEWQPIFFELSMGIGIHVEADLILFSISLDIQISLQVWGPPFGGIATIDLDILSFDIPFGSSREEASPKTIGTWQKFLNAVLIPDDVETETDAMPQLTLNVAQGVIPKRTAKEEDAAEAPAPLHVRPDELQLTLSSTVPNQRLKVGQLGTQTIQSLPKQRQSDTMAIEKRLPLARVNRTEKGSDLRVRPMDADLDATINLAVVHEAQNASLDLSDWTIEPELNGVPAALWDPDAKDSTPSRQPDARLIENCITGLRRLRPPLGAVTEGLSRPVEAEDLGWDHRPEHRVATGSAIPDTAQPAPSGEALLQAFEKSAAKRQAASQTLEALGFAI